jgi:site-specific recombinase
MSTSISDVKKLIEWLRRRKRKVGCDGLQAGCQVFEQLVNLKENEAKMMQIIFRTILKEF